MAYSRSFDAEAIAAAANYAAGDLNVATALTIQSGVAFTTRALKIDPANTNIQHDWAYDNASAFTSGDFTATFLAQMNTVNNSSTCRVGIMFRVNAGGTTGYNVHLRPQAATATVRLSRLSGATETVIATATFDGAATFVADTWYHIRYNYPSKSLERRRFRARDVAH